MFCELGLQISTNELSLCRAPFVTSDYAVKHSYDSGEHSG